MHTTYQEMGSTILFVAVSSMPSCKMRSLVDILLDHKIKQTIFSPIEEVKYCPKLF